MVSKLTIDMLYKALCEIEELHADFVRMAGPDSKLDKKELEAATEGAIESNDLQWNQIDVSGDGLVSLKEWQQYLFTKHYEKEKIEAGSGGRWVAQLCHVFRRGGRGAQPAPLTHP